MMESGSLVERIEKCEKILKENAKSQIFAPLADAMRMNGDLDQAFRVCRQGLRIHPNYGPGHLVMAKINFERRMFDWAEQELEKAVELDGDTRVTEQLRIEILIARGDFSEAEVWMKRLKASGVNPLLFQDLQQRLEKQKRESRRRQLEQPARPTPAVGQSDEQPVAAERHKSPITLTQALDQLHELPYVQSIVCAHANGTVVDYRRHEMQEVSEIAAFGIEMCRYAESDDAVNNLGPLHQIAIETEDRMIVIMKFSRYNLVLYCDKGVNLGAMRLKLDEIAENLLDE